MSIKIVDILGREVASLVNENKLPGKHQVRWFGKTNDYNNCHLVFTFQLKAGLLFVKKLPYLSR